MTQWQPPPQSRYQPPAYVPGMEHFWPQPKPPSWARRHAAALWIAGALILVAAVTALGWAYPNGVSPSRTAPASTSAP